MKEKTKWSIESLKLKKIQNDFYILKWKGVENELCFNFSELSILKSLIEKVLEDESK